MSARAYSREVCRDLRRIVEDSGLAVTAPRDRYEGGDVLDLEFTTVCPEARGRGRFRVERYAGSGFAGQVYACVLEELDPPALAGCALRPGGTYAVKILRPASGFSRFFRDLVYRLGFQAPFTAEVNEAACRAGLLWQKLSRVAAGLEMGDPDAVADVYASFFDPRVRAYGEIREWVEGRTWRMESDTRPGLRAGWRTVRAADTGSPEYVAKRQFMDRFVRLLHAIGGTELARQYEWWTLKSQPNVLKRNGHEGDPGGGLCAVDFRAGLALLPILPMSPVDVKLILRGLCRGALVQFDRGDLRKSRAFAARHAARSAELAGVVSALEAQDTAYRRSLPDVFRQGARLLVDPGLRRDVRRGLAEAYGVRGLADVPFGARLAGNGGLFAGYYVLGGVPVLGRLFRRLWGHAGYREHLRRMLTERGYLGRALRAALARRLIRWHRAGRTGERRTRFLMEHPLVFWLQRLTLGVLPAGLHRALAEPSYVAERVREGWQFVRAFYREIEFRERWFTDQVREGYEDGMLDAEERDAVLARVRDPFIVKYLRSLAVHFATLPVSEITLGLVTLGAVAWAVFTGRPMRDVWPVAGAVAAVFLMLPVSPGSLCRGTYVLYLMIRERNFRDYMIAAPVSFLKVLGYFAFPLQMVTAYPALARFMAARGATRAVRVVPVFGEKGALLEHAVFDLLFNRPRVFGRWARQRIRGLLDIWLVLGAAGGVALATWRGREWATRGWVNLALTVLVLFVLPRVLFYPMLRRRPSGLP